MTRRTRMIVFDFLLRSIAGLLVALPFAAAVTSTTIARYPEGDRLLFAPGGVYLAEAVRLLLPLLLPLLAASVGTTIALSFALVVPHAALLVALAEPEEAPTASFWGRALERVPTLLAVTGIALLAELALLLVFSGLASMAGRAVSAERASDVVSVLVALVGVLLALSVGVVRDLARAGAVRHGLDGPDAIRHGLVTFFTRAGAALPAWLGPALLSCMVVLGAALFAGALDVSRAEPWRAWLVLLVHQGAALCLAFCRAIWLSSSLALASDLSRRS
jgi:hypothetical protein